MSQFSWQGQNVGWLSLAFIINWIVMFRGNLMMAREGINIWQHGNCNSSVYFGLNSVDLPLLSSFRFGMRSNSLRTSPSASLASRWAPISSLGILAGAVKVEKVVRLSVSRSGRERVSPCRVAIIIGPNLVGRKSIKVQIIWINVKLTNQLTTLQSLIKMPCR